jgi:hypothetical protein
MAYTVAQAEVTVLPDAKNFGKDLRAQISPEAEKIGRDIGDKLVRGIRERLAEAHPDVKVDADTDPADRKVDEFLAKMRAKAALAGDDAGKKLGRNMADSAGKEFNGRGALIGTAIAGGLIAGGPILVAAAGALFGGVAAVILHNNAEVAAAASGMAHAVTAEYTQVAQVAVPFLVKALGDIKAAALEMAPAVGSIFTHLQPAVDGLVGGVTDLAKKAMPGLVAAITNGSPVFAGLRSLLAEIGQGLGNFFTILSTHGEAMGTVLSSLGSILDALLSSLGSLAAAGSDLGSMILPPLATVLGAIAGILQVLEPILPGLAIAFAAWKIAGIIAPLMSRMAGALDTIGIKALIAADGMLISSASAGVAAKTFGGAATAARGLEAALGPIGWIAAAVGLLIPLFMGQDDAQKQVTDSAAAMTAALQQSHGVIDENVRSQAAAQAQANGLLDWAKTIGVAYSTVVDALLGVPGAMDDVTAASDAYNAAQAASGQAGYKNADGSYASALAAGKNSQATEKATEANNKHRAALADVAQSVQDEITNQQVLAAAIGGSSDATELNKQRLQDLANAAGAADSQINLLKGALDALTGKAVTLDQAQIAVTNAITSASTALKNMKGPMLDAHGGLDLTTTKGAAAATALIRISDTGHQLIATMEAQGKTSAEVGKASDALRAQFITQAKAMGLSAQAAEDLANKYYGIPKDVHTEIKADTTQADRAIKSISEKLLTLKDRTVVVTTVTREDGSQSVHRGPGMTQALGGVVHAYADGGLEPMQGGVAQVVAPNTWRVIGDRISDDEAYIPINDSARSLAILATTAGRMGFGLSAPGAAGGGKTDARSYHFAISSPSDPQAIARSVRDVQLDVEFLHG